MNSGDDKKSEPKKVAKPMTKERLEELKRDKEKKIKQETVIVK